MDLENAAVELHKAFRDGQAKTAALGGTGFVAAHKTLGQLLGRDI